MSKPPWVRKYYEDLLFPEMMGSNKELSVGSCKVIVGSFFEMLASEIVCGDYSANDMKHDNLKPDVIVWGRRGYCKGLGLGDLLFEVKGSQRGGSFIIDLGQLEFYLGCTGDMFPFSYAQSHYIFFSYERKSLVKELQTEKQLIGWLMQSVRSCLIIPAVVLYKLSESDFNMYSYGRAWGGENGSRGGPNHELYFRFYNKRIENWVENGGYVWMGPIEMLGAEVKPFKLLKVGGDWYE